MSARRAPPPICSRYRPVLDDAKPKKVGAQRSFFGFPRACSTDVTPEEREAAKFAADLRICGEGLAMYPSNTLRPRSRFVLALALLTVPATAQHMGAARQVAALAKPNLVIQEGDQAAAITLLRGVVRDDPANGYGWFRIGQVSESLNRPRDAAAAYRRAADFSPYAVWGLHQAARIYTKLNDADAAIDALSLAVDRGYGDFEEISNEADLQPLRADDRFVDLLAAMSCRPLPRRDLRSSWSPDGREIVFSSGVKGANTFDLFLVRADGTRLRRLTRTHHHDLEPSWSPDGQWIAFARVGGILGTREIFRIRPNGSGLASVTGSGRALDAGMKAMPSWSPDSLNIAVSVTGSIGGVWVVAADGSSSKQLTEEGSWPSFIDNERLVFENDARLHTLDLKAGATAAINADAGFLWWCPSLSPDGASVASCWLPRGGRINQIALTRVETGAIEVITPPDFDTFMPSWSPDGQRIVFARSRHAFGHGGRELHIMNRDGSGLRPLVRTTAR